MALVVDGAEDVFEFAGEFAELGDEVEGLARAVMVPRTCARWRARTKRAVSWAVKALVQATPISGPALVVMVPWALRVMAAPTTLQMARVLRAFGDELGLGGEGVGGFAGLGDEEADGVRVGDGVAVAVLAGVVDVDGEAGEALDHELAGEAGVPGGSAGGDGDLAGVADLVVGDVQVVEEDVAGVEGDAAEGGVADGAGLLVDFLEHEVLVAGLFGLDGVPGDALDFEREGGAVEVGEGDACGGEDGDFAVLEEVDVAGVVEDAGDVGGEEVFAFADADDGGRAHAGGDELVGLVGGEDADGEGSGEALDGAADGFF